MKEVDWVSGGLDVLHYVVLFFGIGWAMANVTSNLAILFVLFVVADKAMHYTLGL